MNKTTSLEVVPVLVVKKMCCEFWVVVERLDVT